MSVEKIQPSAALERLNRGDEIFMEIGPEGEAWWFEAPYQILHSGIARTILKMAGAGECGDSLFPTSGSSQTWRVACSRS